jgi:hypothetical protein
MTHSVEVNTPLEALLAEQALAMVRELGSAAAAGPDGERGLLAAVGAAARQFPEAWVASGAVEGLARRMGDRLKTPGRGWREDHLDPTATLVNLVQTTKWPELCKPSVN